MVIKLAVLYLLTTTAQFYSQDGLKVPSEEAIFALLGADGLTRGKGDSHDCHTGLSKDSFLNKLRVSCKTKVMDTPFL